MPAFSLDGMMMYFELISRKTEILVDILLEGSKKDGSVDVHPPCSHYTFDVIAEVCFGRDYDAQRTPCEFLGDFNDAMKLKEDMQKFAFKSVAVFSIAATALLGGVGAKLFATKMNMDADILKTIKDQRAAIESGSIKDQKVKVM